MASVTNLEDLPQLVMEKITSFLNHKQLLALEQTSTKLKCAVDAHFDTTNHLIIGPLPEINWYGAPTVEDKKYVDGLLRIMKRCGIRLRIIQIGTTFQFPYFMPICIYRRYYRHFFASAEISNNCPNIENILVSPKMDTITQLDHDMFRQQNVLLYEDDVILYANNIKLSTGGSCKLRSMQLSRSYLSYQVLLNLLPNLQQISIYIFDENFCETLPQLMENGLKDLSISVAVNLGIATKYCNLWKDLRTLRFVVNVENVNNIEALNALQLPKNVVLKIEKWNADDSLAHLNDNVCNFITSCDDYAPTEYKLLRKLKNLQEFNIRNSEELQVLAEGSFPNLRRIRDRYSLCSSSHCDRTNTCPSEPFLPLVLINKGNQLTHIDIRTVCNKSMHLVWKMIKHCKAAIEILLYSETPLTATYTDVEAIYSLPNLQHFLLSVAQKDNYELRALFERAIKERSDFQVNLFEDSYCQQFTLYRINL